MSENPLVENDSAAQETPLRTPRTGTYAFAIAAAIVAALGLGAVSFGAGVFVGRASDRFSPGRQVIGGAMQGAPGIQGGQQQMPPGAWGDQGGTQDGDGRRGPRGRGGRGQGWQQAPDGSTQLTPDTSTPRAPTQP